MNRNGPGYGAAAAAAANYGVLQAKLDAALARAETAEARVQALEGERAAVVSVIDELDETSVHYLGTARELAKAAITLLRAVLRKAEEITLNTLPHNGNEGKIASEEIGLPTPLGNGETEALCSDCPPVGYPTDETRCLPCPRRTDGQGE